MSGTPSYPELEHEVLAFWQERRVFDRLREKNRGRRHWSFIDGPITANNPMGVHHAWGRTYKDIFQRFRAMCGFDQRFQNGFDGQGLWVEVEVEKELGLDSKREIAAYGLDRFAEACRARVEKYSRVQTEQSKRLGQWMDWDHSYFTTTDVNIEYIWHFLQECHRRGWLYRGLRAMPWCVRCGTSLSQHELIDSYQDMTHLSVFVKLPLADRPGEFILVWTTTPWTLTANTALAVHPQLDYLRVRLGEDILYLGAGALGRLGLECEVLGKVTGSELVGLRYRGPLCDLPAQHGLDTRVVAWDEVGEDEGTGVVHIAPGCGEEDYELSRQEGLPVLAPIDENGVYGADYGWLAGKRAGEVATLICEDLERKGMLHATEDYEHRYPVCWRCREPLVFRLVEEWFISCDGLREPMLEETRKVRWIPAHAGKRMADWLNNMGDWCISRKRFWGLPLPFYQCACGELTVLGSRRELEALAVSAMDQLRELHRPWIDAVRIRCPRCGGEVSRIPEVGDCWLDAGIVAFSTLGYLEQDNSYWRKWFPADFVTEMREQIRLWFYAMMFMSVTLTGRAPYRTVLVHERVHDEQGRPMHKSLGNAIWFDQAVERMGADVMRWIYAGANLQTNLNFGYGKGEDALRKLLTLWNVYSFFVTYARVDGWRPSRLPGEKGRVPPAAKLDRWMLSRLNSLTVEVTNALEGYDAARVTAAVEAFMDDLSNWYVRLSRRRFWKSQADEDKQSAYAALYEALVTLAQLLAPVLPFTAERLYQGLVREAFRGAPESVHLCDWPAADESLADETLEDEMAATMKVVRLGRAARSAAGIKVRQPLAGLTVRPADEAERRAVAENEELILAELNVKSMAVVDDASALLEHTVRPNPALLGPRYGKLLAGIRAALEAADAEALAQRIACGNPVEVAVAGQAIVLRPDDLLVDARPRAHLSCAQESGTVVAVDTALTEALIQEGVARDLVRHIQNLRKECGFQVDDRIVITYRAGGAVADAIAAHEGYIRRETLAVQLVSHPQAGGLATVSVAGEEVGLKLERA